MVALTAVTVSINYSDYLRRCVAQNAAVLDRWIIVTDQSDRRTIDICRHFNNIELVFTKVDFQPGVLFPKSRMINEGFGTSVVPIGYCISIWTYFFRQI